MGHLGHRGHARLGCWLEQYVPGAFPSETLCAILRALVTEEEARLLALLPLRPVSAETRGRDLEAGAGAIMSNASNMIYADVLRAFDEEGVLYLIVGGFAVNLYGYVRLTVDLDIMVDLEARNLMNLVKIMERLNYTPRVPVKSIHLIDEKTRDTWIKEKGAVVFTFIDLKDPVKHIDIFLKNPVDFERAYHARKVLTLKGIQIHVISIQDLIALKQLSGMAAGYRRYSTSEKSS